MQAVTDIGTLITRRVGILGDRPSITGTRVSVQRVTAWYKMGLNAEKIVERIGNLNLAQVYAALTYYYANRAEIAGYLLAEKENFERLASEVNPQY